MPVPKTFADISQTASLNSPTGSEPVGPNSNAYLQQSFSFSRQLYDTTLPRAGGTMSGPITLAADPVAAMQPVTKSYGDTYYKFASTGGQVGAWVRFLATTNPSAQGLSIGWNEDGNGTSMLVNNQGLGGGGFVLRTVNSNNTVELGRVSIGANGSFNTGNVLQEMGSRVWTQATFNPGAYQPAGDYATNTYVNNLANTKAPIRNGNGGYGYVVSDTGNKITLNWDGTTNINAFVDSSFQGGLITTNNLTANVQNSLVGIFRNNQIGAYAIGTNGSPNPPLGGSWVAAGTASNSVWLWVRVG